MGAWRTTARRAATAAVVLALAALTAATPGCGEGEASSPSSTASPQREPDITGVVWQVGGDGSGSLLVVGLEGGSGGYDRAWVRLTDDTAWHAKDGSAIGAPPLDRELIGRRVDVTFTGAVAESYPVQAAASSVTLIDPLGVSMNVTLIGEPQLNGTALTLDLDAEGKVTALTLLPDEGAAQDAADVVQVTIKVTRDTQWVLDTPTEFKTSRAPLIGNGIEPRVEVSVKEGQGDAPIAAEWIVVRLRDVDAGA